VDGNKNDIGSWEKLLDVLEYIVDNEISNKGKVDDRFKKLVHVNFDQLLSRFPLFFGYWKKYVSIELKMNGLNSCVKILQRSLDMFPNSIDLWLDYLNIILENKLHNDNTEFMINLFEQSLDNCGRQYLSHPLWDKYLEYLANIYGEKSLEYLKILLKIIKLPLHQYAKYFNKFYEIKENFTSNQLINEEENIDESKIDEFFLKIFNKTKDATNARWKYESKLSTNYFNLVPIKDSEISIWIEYLDFEESQGDHEQIKSLYERCLIPLAFYEKFWIKYLKWFIKNENDSIQEIKSIFERGCNLFIPIEFNNLRLMYALYLERLNLKDESFQIYLNILKISIKNNKFEIEILIKLIKFLKRFINDDAKFIDFCKIMLENGINDQIINNEEEILHQDKKQILDKLIPLLTIEIIEYLWFKLNDKNLTRDFFLKNYQNNLMKLNVEFWIFFLKFEICYCNNLKNLNNIITYIKLYSELPPIIVEFFIRISNNFNFKNSSYDNLISSRSNLIKMLLEIDDESFYHQRTFSKARKILKDDTVDKELLKENGHPGIETESKPIITNRIDFEDHYCNLNSHIPEEVPLLPTFKNVEKANLAIKYP
ncbi:hypothetical protein PACTADRAFT_20229, partial [Pachysolen tannophilus NRRL Y-2460]